MVERIPREPSGMGRRLSITTNAFQLSMDPQNASLYFVEYHPELPDNARRERRRILNSLRNRIESHIGRFYISGLNIIALNAVPEPFSVLSNDLGQEYLLNIRNVGRIDRSNMFFFKMYLNIALKNSLAKLNFRQITRMPHFYNPDTIKSVERLNLSIWEGYSASFGNHIQGILLNIDVVSKIIRNMTMLALINQIRQSTRGGNYRERVLREVKYSICMATYGNNRNYRIDSILWNENPRGTFVMDNHQTITFVDYYIRTYDIRIRDLRQPLILSIDRRTGKELKLIPELMNPTGLTDKMREDFRLRSEIAKHTRLEPAQRLEKNVSLARRLAEDPNVRQVNDEFDFHIDPNTIKVNAEILSPEAIVLGNGQRINIDPRANFNFKGILLEPVPIRAWAVLSTERDRRQQQRLIEFFRQNSPKIGLEMNQLIEIEFNQRNIEEIFEWLARDDQGTPPVAMTIVVLPRDMKYLYSKVKENSCRLGLPTQVVLTDKISKPKNFHSIMTKVMIQIACKTGSMPWKTQPVRGIPNKTMVIGIDVHHDNVQRTNSVVGFVASIHPNFNKYYNCAKIQPRQGEEIITNIKSSFHQSLTVFYEERRCLPELIIVYRDGVGDSQVEAVREYEVKAMKEAIGSMENYQPGFVYIVVNKYTNMRFYVEGHETSNPPPGTFVDKDVVPDQNSFYMQSQAANQGQAKPTLYRVIAKELYRRDLSTKTLALLTLKLCYLYPNWTGAIKIPAPVMMADRLAIMVGQNVHGAYHARINNLNWFL